MQLLYDTCVSCFCVCDCVSAQSWRSKHRRLWSWSRKGRGLRRRLNAWRPIWRVLRIPRWRSCNSHRTRWRTKNTWSVFTIPGIETRKFKGLVVEMFSLWISILRIYKVKGGVVLFRPQSWLNWLQRFPSWRMPKRRRKMRLCSGKRRYDFIFPI